MRAFPAIIAVALCSAAALLGADVTGVWKADFTTPDGTQRQSTFHLKADGEKLTGKVINPTGEVEIKDGVVKGDDVSFSVVRNFNGQDFTIKYAGKVTGDELKLKVTFNEDTTFDIVAKRQPAAGASAAPPSGPPLQPQPLVPGARVLALWPAGSPMLRNADQKEVFTMTSGQPDRVQKVVNINNPSIELHLAPPEKANGLGIILAAGGGNTELNVGTEGIDVAKWLNDLGVSAFILRYRLRPYSSSVDALADSQQSIRMVRAHAKEWGIDPNRIGFMGFSAGGEQAARVALNFDEPSRPDFVVLVYAGWGKLDLSTVPKNAPPAFLTSAGIDDAFHARQTVDFYNAYFNAKPPIPVELHIYGHGGHANGIKPRNGIPFGTWHVRFLEWAADLGMMKKGAGVEGF